MLGRGPGRCTLALIDCDHFKQVNDRASHVAGDQVLKRIGKVLHAACRRTDVAARFGGDEFALVFADATIDDAKGVCERIRNVVERHADDGAPRVTVSIGLAAAVDGDTVESLLKRADAALYRAKGEGRNRVAVDV
jgi:diguanylate cyclase (GGDEF)-like protein